MNPEQQLYRAIEVICIGVIGKSNVWTYNPPEGTDYPFIRVGEIFQQNRRLHKKELNGDMQVTVHVWHDNTKERGTLTDLMSQIGDAVIERFGVEGEEITSRVLNDNSTAVNLLHGVLEINIKNYK